VWSRGVLLLRRGSVISSSAQLERLIENGLYSDDPAAHEASLRKRALVSSYVPVKPPGARVSVVQSLAAAREGAETMLADTDATHFPARVLELARQIRGVATLDPDAAIGNIVASRGTPYPARHAVNCTALASLLLARQEGTEEQIEACLCAVLTMNLSTVDLQAELYAQQAPMSEAQKTATRNHPLRSVEMLRARGVESAPWLAAVLGHHELLDGSGYPMGLAGDAIPIEAQIVAVADVFDALTSRRPYKEPWPVEKAIAEVQSMAPVKLNADCVAALIAALPQARAIVENFADN
jgi:HD-GYP domain-containing protein (c-di-GMP phosphodiesterase class II)